MVSTVRAAALQVDVRASAAISRPTLDAPGDQETPTKIWFDAAPGQSVVFTSVSGVISCCGITGFAGPDGGAFALSYPPFLEAPLVDRTGTDIDANANGVSGIKFTGRSMFLVGMFTESTLSSTAPERLDFTPGIGIGEDFASLTPALQQVFFIGDGRDLSGALQTFFVPASATTLYLGYADAVQFQQGYCCYSDNVGGLTVVVDGIDPTSSFSNPIPSGTSSVAPLPPATIGPDFWEFDDVGSGNWIDPPFVNGFEYEITDPGVYFSSITFPTGTGFEMWTDLILSSPDCAAIPAGASFGHKLATGFSFAGAGCTSVSRFRIESGSSIFDFGDPLGFPLQVFFAHASSASIVMTPLASPIPEPATFAGVLVAAGAGFLARRFQRRHRLGI